MKPVLHSGLFVTGTDTGVGKTFVSASILSALRSRGCDAVPMKPVQTGCVQRQGRLIAPDLAFCLKVARLTPSQSDRCDMAPFCFKPACSPHLAAQRTGATIRFSVIRKAFCRLSRAHEFVVVEGAGGVLVPLNRRKTMLDLMVALRLPVLLVARPGLGTINHTLLSLEALSRVGLDILGVVLNQSNPGRWGDIENDNLQTIERMSGVKVLACIRYGESPGRIQCALAGLPPILGVRESRSR